MIRQAIVVTCITLGVFVMNATAYASNVRSSESLHRARAPIVYGMRKFPYPYDAMLAISSDADHETLRKFNLIHEFINTTAMTPMGKGLGLDFADSFFMYNGSNLPGAVDYHNTPLSDELTYFRGVSNKPFVASILNRYIHAGWIDTLHSFGDFSRVNVRQTKFTRRLAVQARKTLGQNHDLLTVWTDHGNPSNVDDFGSYGRSKFFGYQQGANPWSRYHVTDLLIPYGVHFVWADQPSDQFGYYSIIYPKKLPDGRTVWAFWRYTNTTFTNAGNPEWAWTVDDLDQELTIKNILELEYFHQYAIVAQHLEADNTRFPLPKSAVEALQLLAKQYHEGQLLVTRTSRLLQYNVTQKYLRYHVTTSHGRAVIHITAIADPVFGSHRPDVTEIRGVTFYSSNPKQTIIEIGNTPISPGLIQYNRKDRAHPSIEVKWFPVDTRNYTVFVIHKHHVLPETFH